MKRKFILRAVSSAALIVLGLIFLVSDLKGILALRELAETMGTDLSSFGPSPLVMGMDSFADVLMAAAGALGIFRLMHRGNEIRRGRAGGKALRMLTLSAGLLSCVLVLAGILVSVFSGTQVLFTLPRVPSLILLIIFIIFSYLPN